MPYRGHGVIKRSKKWRLTPKREAALKRLVELKVDVYSAGTNDYTLLVLHDLSSPEYIEIGYLIAQLGDEQFPENYSCLSGTETKVFKTKRSDPLPVWFVESYPHGMKYRVTPSDVGSQETPANKACT